MIVVSNTSPVCYLVWIGEAAVLPRLFGELFISAEVQAELAHPDAPPQVRAWIQRPPAWLQVQPIAPAVLPPQPPLDRGERSAIELALHLKAGLLLVDDSVARCSARSRGLTVMGLLGVLLRAHGRGLVDARDCVRRLRATTFYMSDGLLRAASAASGIPLV